MTLQELKQLIESDAEATRLWSRGTTRLVLLDDDEFLAQLK